jgi:Zn finger protein HypA/HybF involved in hydrogenase expression
MEMEHLRRVLDYLPCATCEEATTEEERDYLCTVCARLNRVVSAEKAIPKWKLEDGAIVAMEGIEVDELKPSIEVTKKVSLCEEEPAIIEVEVLEIGETVEQEALDEELPGWGPVADEPYTHGEYTLHTKEVLLRGNRTQRIYFFSKKIKEDAEPVPLPDGFVVRVNERTGLPYLKKA